MGRVVSRLEIKLELGGAGQRQHQGWDLWGCGQECGGTSCSQEWCRGHVGFA